MEHAEDGEGSWSYDLYSDGWIVQRGKVDKSSSNWLTITVTFPKEFTTKPDLYIGIDSNNTTVDGAWRMFWFTNLTETSFVKHFWQDQGGRFNWKAEGYVA